MLLSEFDSIAAMRTVRDGAFEHVGKASSLASAMIAPINDAAFIPKIRTQKHIIGVICTPELADQVPADYLMATAASPKNAILAIHETLFDRGYYARETPTVIHPTARVHPTSSIHPTNVVIGAHCDIGPNVTILGNVTLGEHVTLAPGVILGTDGYDVTQENGRTRFIKQAGTVVIDSYVNIQANCSVAHGTFAGVTHIGENVLIDSLVHINHDVKIGRGTKICAGAIISGSVVIGEQVWIGPNATLSNALTIGDGAYISLGSVVTRDILPKQKVSGNFAVTHARFIEFIKSIR